jgi:hypothetical protein
LDPTNNFYSFKKLNFGLFKKIMKKSSNTGKKTAFVADERNSGGRTQITQLLYNHYNALINTKPTIKMPQDSMAQWNTNSHTSTYKSTRATKNPTNIRQKSSKIRRPQSKASKNSMAGTSARNINDTNHLHARPVSAQYGKYRGRNYKDDDHVNREHMLNLKSQYRKISEMGYSYNDRKKRPYDPVANPALVFKRKKPRGVSSEVAGPGPNKYHNYDQEYQQSKVVKSVSKPKRAVQSATVASKKQRIYRTEYGDFTEDQLREILKWQQAELEKQEAEKLRKKKVVKRRKIPKPAVKREPEDVPLNHHDLVREQDYHNQRQLLEQQQQLRQQQQHQEMLIRQQQMAEEQMAHEDLDELHERMRPKLKKKKVVKPSSGNAGMAGPATVAVKKPRVKKTIVGGSQQNVSSKMAQQQQQQQIQYVQMPDGQYYAVDPNQLLPKKKKVAKTVKKKPKKKIVQSSSQNGEHQDSLPHKYFISH